MQLSRRSALAAFATAALAARQAQAFGQVGAFNPRLLEVTGSKTDAVRATAPGRWAWELVRRTSAPARLATTNVAADQPGLNAEPFVVWAGAGNFPPLSAPELRGIERFIKLGGLMVVDDNDPASGAFGRAARRELRRVLPESPVVKLDAAHVIYKSYYIIDRPVGRVQGPAQLEAIVRGKTAQVIFSSHDLLGALARSRGGSWSLEVEPGGVRQREYAIRLSVNIAMYVLCSDYKDDQVHAPWLMRRRAQRRP
jgi:hypothetical protein